MEEPRKIDNRFVRKVCIGTAFYEVKGYSPYITSLVSTIRALEAMKMPWDFYEISGDSYVDRAKNSLANRFMDDQEATHLFIIDSDESWDVESFLRVLRAAMLGAELVGGSYPCKNNWDFYGCIPLTKEEDGLDYFIGETIQGVTLLEMFCIPGGFTCYSKAAFKRVEPLLSTYYAYDTDTKEKHTYLEYFHQMHSEKDGGKVGEDIYFQQRFKEAGGKIFMEPNCNIAHWGVQRWVGNFQEKVLKERLQAKMQSEFEKNCANLETMKSKIEEKAKTCASA